MAARLSIDELKQRYLDSDREYQFALASGDRPRLTAALVAYRAAFKAYNDRKRRDFNRRFQAELQQRSQAHAH
jgi:hypothetical protein